MMTTATASAVTMTSSRGEAGAFTGQDAASFRYKNAGLPGQVTVNPMSTFKVEIQMTPSEKRTYEARVTLRGPGGRGALRLGDHQDSSVAA